MEQEDALLLRKINRIKTIQGSLAIEGNTLSESQITDILDGKHISHSLRHSERLITSLKQKGMIQRVGSNKNEYWEIIVK